MNGPPQYIKNKDPNRYDVDDPADNPYTMGAIQIEERKENVTKAAVAVAVLVIVAWMVMS